MQLHLLWWISLIKQNPPIQNIASVPKPQSHTKNCITKDSRSLWAKSQSVQTLHFLNWFPLKVGKFPKQIQWKYLIESFTIYLKALSSVGYPVKLTTAIWSVSTFSWPKASWSYMCSLSQRGCFLFHKQGSLQQFSACALFSLTRLTQSTKKCCLGINSKNYLII